MKDTVKALVNSLAETMNERIKVTGLEPLFDEKDPGQLVMTDLILYAMYLTASDGEVRESEAEKITENFGYKLNPVKIGKLIREYNLYSNEFESEVPISLELLMQVDNAFHEQGLDKEPAEEVIVPICESVYRLFKDVTELVITADGEVHEQEKADADIYLSMLNRFLDEKLDARNDPDKGITKSE